MITKCKKITFFKKLIFTLSDKNVITHLKDPTTPYGVVKVVSHASNPTNPTPPIQLPIYSPNYTPKNI